MKNIFDTCLPFMIMACLASCNGAVQNKSSSTRPAKERVGGPCEAGNCELMYYGMPTTIDAIDTSAGWYEAGQKLIVSGTVYKADGKTPAPDVMLYYHHTDSKGYYSPTADKPENQTRHGHIRGWVKTGNDGHYTIYSIRPAPYPNRSAPAHIHWLIKEPEIDNEYWADDLVFADDSLLLPFLQKNKPENRCGSGVVHVIVKDSVQTAMHDFVLGLNIPGYTKNK
jgi:protocatechuate 3,4-dioxygenase, beta subunit